MDRQANIRFSLFPESRRISHHILPESHIQSVGSCFLVQKSRSLVLESQFLESNILVPESNFLTLGR